MLFRSAHDQVEAFALSDRVALLREGRLVMYDTPGTLYTRPADLFAASFIGGGRMNLLPGILPGGKVLFGIFPENLSLASGLSPEDLSQGTTGKIIITAISDGLVRKGTSVTGAFSVPAGSCLTGVSDGNEKQRKVSLFRQRFDTVLYIYIRRLAGKGNSRDSDSIGRDCEYI